MTSYRRNFIPGASYFFTVNLTDRRRRLLTDHIDLLRDAFRAARRQHPFFVDAIVVLPDHLHAVWTLPEGEADFAIRWRLVKAAFSRGLGRGEAVSASRLRKHERGIWQRRYWEHTLRSSTDTPHACEIGRFPRSTGWCGSASTPKIGMAGPEYPTGGFGER